MLIYIKSYIAYSCFRLIEKHLLFCDIWPKPYDYQHVRWHFPRVTLDFIADTAPRNVNRS